MLVGISLALPLEEEHHRKARQAEAANNLSLFQLLFSTMAEFQRTFGPIISYLIKEKLNIIAALLRTPAGLAA